MDVFGVLRGGKPLKLSRGAELSRCWWKRSGSEMSDPDQDAPLKPTENLQRVLKKQMDHQKTCTIREKICTSEALG